MNKTRAGSLVLFVAGAYGFMLSLRLPLGKLNAPGAGAFPLIVSILLTLSGIFMFVGEGKKVEFKWRELIHEQRTPFQIVVLTAGFILALDRLGYLLSSTAYMFALLFWVSRYRLRVSIALAVALGVGSWYVFGMVFETPLPVGILAR